MASATTAVFPPTFHPAKPAFLALVAVPCLPLCSPSLATARPYLRDVILGCPICLTLFSIGQHGLEPPRPAHQSTLQRVMVSLSDGMQGSYIFSSSREGTNSDL